MHSQIIDLIGLAASGAVGGAIYWAARNHSGVFRLAWKSINRN
ncbi:MAG: hypothetical protein ABWZ40_14000 [Caulobacterales bacterium]